MDKPKKSLISTKVTCAKCGKEYFVSFVADGHRNYYCDDCLREMHFNRKRGEIKKVFNDKLKKYVYEFICDVCETFRRASYYPKRENGKIWCRECEANHRQELQKQQRENRKVIIVNEEQAEKAKKTEKNDPSGN
ncbi:hypothetical protein J5834_06195 [bacterium]|nr:hypothetical protein [bacterium]